MKKLYAELGYRIHPTSINNTVYVYADESLFGKTLLVYVTTTLNELEEHEEELPVLDRGTTVYHELLESDITTICLRGASLPKGHTYEVNVHVLDDNDESVAEVKDLLVHHPEDFDLEKHLKNNAQTTLDRFEVITGGLSYWGGEDVTLFDSYIAGRQLEIRSVVGRWVLTTYLALEEIEVVDSAPTFQELFKRIKGNGDLKDIIDSGLLFERFMSPITFDKTTKVFSSRVRLMEDFVFKNIDDHIKEVRTVVTAQVPSEVETEEDLDKFIEEVKTSINPKFSILDYMSFVGELEGRFEEGFDQVIDRRLFLNLFSSNFVKHLKGFDIEPEWLERDYYLSFHLRDGKWEYEGNQNVKELLEHVS